MIELVKADSSYLAKLQPGKEMLQVFRVEELQKVVSPEENQILS
jgi:hypothetical protein